MIWFSVYCICQRLAFHFRHMFGAGALRSLSVSSRRVPKHTGKNNVSAVIFNTRCQFWWALHSVCFFDKCIFRLYHFYCLIAVRCVSFNNGWKIFHLNDFISNSRQSVNAEDKFPSVFHYRKHLHPITYPNLLALIRR